MGIKASSLLVVLMICCYSLHVMSFIIKLYSETQVSGRLGMSGGISPRHAQNPLSGERRKTLSITHHALSPPPSHHHLYIIHLINWLQRFYRIIMSLKRPFVPKSDVKQWFTTTTTTTCHDICVGLYCMHRNFAAYITFRIRLGLWVAKFVLWIPPTQWQLVGLQQFIRDSWTIE